MFWGLKILGHVISKSKNNYVHLTIDIDECTDETHNCDINADCTNQAGNFNCSCKSGYIGDGTDGNCIGNTIIHINNANNSSVQWQKIKPSSHV